MTDAEKLIEISQKIQTPTHILFKPWISLEDAMQLLRLIGRPYVIHIEPCKAFCYIWDSGSMAPAPKWVRFSTEAARAIFEAVYEACQ
jgi:hypothetical protein